jgi:hypothetical protein
MDASPLNGVDAAHDLNDLARRDLDSRGASLGLIYTRQRAFDVERGNPLFCVAP